MTPTSPGRVLIGGRGFAVEALTDPAPGKDHDAYLVRPDVAIVADGVTPLDGVTGVDTRRFADDACEHLAAHRGRPAASMVGRTIAALQDQVGARRDRCCAVAALHILGDALELLSLGDCLAVVRLTSGETLVAFDDRVAGVERPLEDELRRLLLAGVPSSEALAVINARLPEIRRHENTPDGYWVLGSDPAAALHVVTVRAPLADVDAVLLCSDGFARLWTTFGCAGSPGELLDLARRDGLDAAVIRLRATESAPGSLVERPRLSPMDDATAVLLTATASAR